MAYHQSKRGGCGPTAKKTFRPAQLGTRQIGFGRVYFVRTPRFPPPDYRVEVCGLHRTYGTAVGTPAVPWYLYLVPSKSMSQRYVK